MNDKTVGDLLGGAFEDPTERYKKLLDGILDSPAALRGRVVYLEKLMGRVLTRMVANEQCTADEARTWIAQSRMEAQA